MRVIRNEVGNPRFPEYGTLKSFDILDIDSNKHTALIMSLHYSIELYQSKGWDKDEEMKKYYVEFVSLHQKLTDYMNHEKSFNGRMM